MTIETVDAILATLIALSAGILVMASSAFTFIEVGVKPALRIIVTIRPVKATLQGIINYYHITTVTCEKIKNLLYKTIVIVILFGESYSCGVGGDALYQLGLSDHTSYLGFFITAFCAANIELLMDFKRQLERMKK